MKSILKSLEIQPSILDRLEIKPRSRKPFTGQQLLARRAARALWKKANPDKQKEYVRAAKRRSRARLRAGLSANDNTPR